MNYLTKDEDLSMVEKTRFHAEWCAAEGKVTKDSPLTGTSDERIERIAKNSKGRVDDQFEAIETSNINASAKDIVLDMYIEDGVSEKLNHTRIRNSSLMYGAVGIASN